jgi:putative ABC transport system substrate-binding protein
MGGPVKRREFIKLSGAGLGAVAWPPLVARAQQENTRRVGYLFPFEQAESLRIWQACRDGLGALGYAEGQNIRLEPRWAGGQYQRLPHLVEELMRLKVDVIVTSSTPASLAAKAVTNSIPIIFVAVADPAQIGLVDSLPHPDGNVTGFSLMTSDLSGKRLALLREIVGKILRVGILFNPNNESNAVFLAQTRQAAQELGIDLQTSEASDPAEIEQALQFGGAQGMDAFVVLDDPILWAHRKQIVTLAATRKLPALYGFREFVDDGGLISYGPDRLEQYRRTAIYVDKILKGAKPSELPVQQPTKFELAINLRTAKLLGLSVPQTLLTTADEVVE